MTRNTLLLKDFFNKYDINELENKFDINMVDIIDKNILTSSLLRQYHNNDQDMNIINLLAYNGTNDKKEHQYILCYYKQSDNSFMHHEYCCSHYKESFAIVYKLLDLVNNNSNINPVYKTNIKNFKDFLRKKFTDSNYFSTVIDKQAKTNDDYVNGDKYQSFFMTTLLPEILNEFNDNSKQDAFPFRYDKFYESILNEEDDNNKELIPLVNDNDDIAYIDRLLNQDTSNMNKYKNVFIRKTDGKLFKMVNGEAIGISKGTDEYKKIKVNNNCNTTQIKENNGLKCYEYLNDCLLGKNLKGCKRFLTNLDFWSASEKEIENMHQMLYQSFAPLLLVYELNYH
jgi:hypothetical protein